MPRDLEAPIDYRPAKDPRTGEIIQRPFSVLDVVEEAIRAGAFLHDAAARVGVTVETLRDWRRIGVDVQRQIAQGRKRLSDFSRRQRQCGRLAAVMEKAEADARLLHLGTMTRVAQGGIATKEIVEKVNAAGDLIERTERTSQTLPDSRAAAWMLQHRWPNDFHGRQEITGPEGGPIAIDATPALDRLRGILNRSHAQPQNTPQTAQIAPEPATNGSRNGHNGHQTHDP